MDFLLATLFIPLSCIVAVVGVTEDVPPSPPILSPDEQGFIIPGIHEEYLPQPIFYEGYIPLILEYQTPVWNKTEVTFNNWYTCVSETLPFKYSCPVTFHMNKAVVNLHVDFEGLHPAVDYTSSSELDPSKNREVATTTQHFNRLTTSSHFCDKIQSHFPNIYVNRGDFDGYLEALQRCWMEWGWEDEEMKNDFAAFLVQRNIPDFNFEIRAPFTRMEQNFYNTFYKNIIPSAFISSSSSANNSNSTLPQSDPKLDFVASAVLSNSRITLQAGILGLFYAEKNRWIHATSDCLQNLMPHSIVTQDKLRQGLNNITERVGAFIRNEIELSVGPSSSLGKYYTLPLTDCVHTVNNNMFVVRVQVPWIKRNRSKSLQLVVAHNLPFEYKGHVCRIKLGGQNNDHGGFFEDHVSGSHYLYEELTGLAFPTDCKGGALCQVSEYGVTQMSGADRCASALMAMNHSVIRNHCGFVCRKQDLREVPLVTRIHSNQYVVTGSPVTISIHCKNQNFTSTNFHQHFDYFIESPRIGAHLVNLPCNCMFTLKSLAKQTIKFNFYGGGVCPNKTTTTTSSYHNSYGGEDIFTFSQPEVIPIIPFHFAKAKESDNGGGTFYYENLSPDAKVNLADFLDEDRIETYLKENKKVGGKESGPSRGGGGSSGDDNISQVLLGDGEPLSSCSSVTALWAIFIITTIIILTIQGYLLYIMKRNERISYPKDDRILYRAQPPDSPIM